jgi:hypothetical protein
MTAPHPPVWRDPQRHKELRHLVGPGTPLRYGIGQPLGELRGLVAGEHPPEMIADYGEAQQVSTLPL